ncbi:MULTISPECIES: HypC/HybG/HupF family hydrogenase formation chaperone [Jannaschia]|nr:MULTISPECIES: HypC/HybG/HupF family hydrogenase formation chaperone [unclassified Jannaschia]
MGIPLRIETVDGLTAVAADGARRETVDLALVGTQTPGTWVLTHLGAAREVLTERDADLIRAALAGLGRLMQGGELGDAFADIETRGPQLPPHLAAAQAAGQTKA